MITIALTLPALLLLSLCTEENWKSRQRTIDFSTFPQCLALMEMPELLKYGKIIQLNLIFPHFNNSSEKPSNGNLAFPHFHKAFLKKNNIKKQRRLKNLFASLICLQKNPIRPLSFIYKPIVFFVQLSGRFASERVDFFIGICNFGNRFDSKPGPARPRKLKKTGRTMTHFEPVFNLNQARIDDRIN